MNQQSFYHHLLHEAVQDVNPARWVVHFKSGNESLSAYQFSIIEDNSSWIKNVVASVVFVGTLASFSYPVGPLQQSEEIWLHHPDALDKVVDFLKKVKRIEYACSGEF